MFKLFKILFYILLTFFCCLLYVTILNFIPTLGVYINLVYIFFVWLILYTGNNYVLLLAIPAAIFLQPFSITPLYINVVSLTFSLALISQLLLKILTNRSLLIVFVSGLLGAITYRLIFIFYILFGQYILNNFFLSVNLSLLKNFIVESIASSAFLVILYLISTLLLKKLNPRYIKLNSTAFIGPR